MSNTSNALKDELSYDPNNLFDSIIESMNLKNDAQLAKVLEVAPPVISKIRHRRIPVGASLLIQMHEVTNRSIAELRKMMGDTRKSFRSSVQDGDVNMPNRVGDTRQAESLQAA